MPGDPGRARRWQAETLDPAIEELQCLAAEIEPALAIGPDPVRARDRAVDGRQLTPDVADHLDVLAAVARESAIRFHREQRRRSERERRAGLLVAGQPGRAVMIGAGHPAARQTAIERQDVVPVVTVGGDMALDDEQPRAGPQQWLRLRPRTADARGTPRA